MNLFAFPFYDAIEKQTRFSRCAGSAFTLFSSNNRFLPFQITKPADGQLIDCIKVVDLGGDLFYKAEAADIEYQMFTDGQQDFIFYQGGIVQNMNLPLCQPFYLQIGTWFSEVFTVTDVSKLVTLEWQHISNVGPVVYQAGFLQRLHLATVISDPVYPTKQEEQEDGFGINTPTLTTISKRLIFDTDLLPEYLVDALASLPLHSMVRVGSYSNVRNIQVEVDWLESGCMATAQVQFSESEITISRLCPDSLPLQEITQAGYQTKGWLCGDNSSTAPYWQDTGETRCVQVDAPERTLAWRGVDPYCES
jgi:hypothetical protein